jgi:hypothetical protein
MVIVVCNTELLVERIAEGLREDRNIDKRMRDQVRVKRAGSRERIERW